MRGCGVRVVEAELGARGAELGALLRRGHDGYGEQRGGAEELLRRREDGGEFVDGRAELVLQIADEEDWVFCF